MSNQTKQRSAMSISGDIENLVTTQPVDYVTADVRISAASSVLKKYISELYQALEAEALVRGGRMTFDNEAFIRYVATIIKSRIDYVNNKHAILRFDDKVRVPAFLSVALEQIGKVEIPEKGISLIPVYSGETELLTQEEALALSRKLAYFENHGFRFATGYSREREGEVGFMTMELIENKVMCDTNTHHPVYGVLAGFFEVTGLVKVLGAQAFRVKYTELSHVEQLVLRFVQGT